MGPFVLLIIRLVAYLYIQSIATNLANTTWALPHARPSNRFETAGARQILAYYETLDGRIEQAIKVFFTRLSTKSALITP